jgi:hypothetical protein
LRTQFLNIDVDLAARGGFADLVRALTPALIVVHEARGEVSLELSSQPTTVDAAILQIARVYHKLPPESRAIWRKCDSRVLNVGIQAGREPHESRFTISRKSLSLLTALQSDLTVTIYAPG